MFYMFTDTKAYFDVRIHFEEKTLIICHIFFYKSCFIYYVTLCLSLIK